MSKINIDKLVCDLVEVHARITGIDRDLVSTYLDDALVLQGLRVRNGALERLGEDEYLNEKIEKATPHLELARQEIEKAKEYQFAKAAMERRWGDESPIEGFEEGAEYGYKFAIEKACEWLSLHDNHASTSVFLDKFKKAMKGE